ncbi:MAG: class I SAM-dependent methyltransferase [Candidatus Nanopelagicales bacterium]
MRGGLDPSLAMLAEARRSGLPAEAVLVAGKAEFLPFAGPTFDAAWLSAVIHHVTDRARVRSLVSWRPRGASTCGASLLAQASLTGCPTFPAPSAPSRGFPPLRT